jgi:hypothetical protein
VVRRRELAVDLGDLEPAAELATSRFAAYVGSAVVAANQTLLARAGLCAG